MNDKVKYWVDLAEYDFDTANAMQETKRYLYVGFMCHQTIEKGIKGIIADSGIFPPKSHNLIELAKNANIYGVLSQDQKDFLLDLNPLNIEARYPTYVNKINSTLTESKCKTILSDTEVFFKWIKARL